MKFPALKGKCILAPMSGVSDVAFRCLAKRYGCALTYTEFVSSAALTRKNAKTMKMLVTDKSEKIKAVQLFGSKIDEIVSAAQFVEEKFDIIDINCGCPAKKIAASGAGSALLKEPAQIEKLISNVVSVVDKPVTIKIRSGIDEKYINAVAVARSAESAGAAAITVHGRTQKQGYAGKADWDIIKKVKQSVNIPVIGNGDVISPEQFVQRLEQSCVDYIMIGRAAMHNPYIFKQISDYMKIGSYDKKSSIEQFFEYMELAEKYDISFLDIKGHALHFMKSAKGAAVLRRKIAACNKLEEIKDVLSA